MKGLSPKHLFYTLLIVAVITRIWDLFHIPFTYDELSTLYRIDGSWEEIKLKIAADNHPPGHHMIAYVLKSLFGLHAWVLKLPFIIAGLGSLVLIYRIGRDWISETTGILSMALLTASQFHVMHSQISRPYALGQFFILLFVYVLGRVIIKKLSFRWLDYALLVVCIVGSAYLHYVSLLVISILWLLAVFCFREIRTQRVFALLPLVSIVLCIPMFSVFLEQWSHKGLSSIMSTPDLSLLLNHLFRVANFSWIFSGVLIAIILYGWITGGLKQNRRRVFFLLSFLIPLIILWAYSVLRSPLLSDRSLYFSLPFVLLFVFSFDLKKYLFPASLVVLVLGVYTLIFEREHYYVFYHQGFEDVPKNLEADLLNAEVSTKTLSIINYNPETYNTIKSKHYIFEDLEHLNPDSLISFREYLPFIERPGYEQLIFANTAEFYAAPLEIIPLIEETFPNRRISKNYFLSHYYVFDKKGEVRKNNSLSLKMDTNDKRVFSNLGGKEVYTFQGEPYGFELLTPLNELALSNSDYLFFRVEYDSPTYVEPRILIEIKDGEELLYHKSNRVTDYQMRLGTKHFTSYLAIDLSDLNLKIQDLDLKAYVWNLHKETFSIHSAEVWTEDGNKYKYALTQDF